MKSLETTVPLIVNGDLAANYTSPVFQLASFPLISLHWWISTGSATGSLTLQVSDYEDDFTSRYLGLYDNPAPPAVGKWQLLSTYIPQWVNLETVKTFPVTNAFTATAISASVPVNGFLNLDCSGFKWVRLVYTRTSGSGTLQARITGKRNKSSVI